jgi:hypothetical protein
MAYQQVLSTGIVNDKRWGKPKANPSRTAKAQIATLFDQESIKIRVLFFDRAGHEIDCRELTSVEPSYIFLDQAFGKFHWISDKCVRLKSKEKGRYWDARL